MEKNPFVWDHIELNLPGLEEYRASIPWIRKIRRDGKSAAALAGYVDDFRIVSGDKESAWICSSMFAKIMCLLGMQDAARKRRRPSKKPGAWAGATVSTDNEGVCKGVSKE